jgi:hypothetical protein
VIKSVCFLFQCKTGRKSTIWNTSVRGGGVGPKAESPQASDALNQKIFVAEWLILKVSEFMCGKQKNECYL